MKMLKKWFPSTLSQEDAALAGIPVAKEILL
jgi:hypothetical protein